MSFKPFGTFYKLFMPRLLFDLISYERTWCSIFMAWCVDLQLSKVQLHVKGNCETCSTLGIRYNLRNGFLLSLMIARKVNNSIALDIGHCFSINWQKSLQKTYPFEITAIFFYKILYGHQFWSSSNWASLFQVNKKFIKIGNELLELSLIVIFSKCYIVVLNNKPRL